MACESYSLDEVPTAVAATGAGIVAVANDV